MSLTWETEALAAQGHRHRPRFGDAPMSWRALAQGLVDDASTRESLTACIAASPHPAVYWETVPVAADTTERPFEMVVLPARGLARISGSPSSFAEHLGPGPRTARAFSNLRADSRLIAPVPVEGRSYGHLAVFLRNASAAEHHALWRRVGEEVLAWWSSRATPVWVSTAGDAVPWLHVRLDPRPKSVKHPAYRDDR